MQSAYPTGRIMDTELDSKKEFKVGISRADIFPLPQASCYLSQKTSLQMKRLASKIHTRTKHNIDHGKSAFLKNHIFLFCWQPGRGRFYFLPPCHGSTPSCAVICVQGSSDSQRGVLGTNGRILGKGGKE